MFPIIYIFLFIPGPEIFNDYKLPLVIGFFIAWIGQAIRITTIGLKYIVRGGRNRKVYAEDLVTEGLFAHIRNPLYLGNVLILTGLGIMSNSLYFNIIITPLFFLFYHAIIHAEENFLRNKFHETYDEYFKKTNRWFPKLNGLYETIKSMEFKWKRVVINEYTSFYIWHAGAVLVLLKTFYYMSDKTYFEEYNKTLILTVVALLFMYLFTRYLKYHKL